MHKNRVLIISLSLVMTLACLAFVYAKFALFPRQWEAELFFMYKEKSLDGFVDEFEKHSDIRQISVIGDSVWVEKFESDIKLKVRGEEADKYRNMINGLGIPMHWKTNDGTLVHLTSASKFEKHFELAFIRRENRPNKRNCKLSLLEEELGECEITLSEKWSLNYTWIPQI